MKTKFTIRTNFSKIDAEKFAPTVDFSTRPSQRPFVFKKKFFNTEREALKFAGVIVDKGVESMKLKLSDADDAEKLKLWKEFLRKEDV